MGLLDRFTNKDLLKGGLPGTAVVRHRQRQYGGEDASELSSSARYELDLEVTVEGRDPYPVNGTFRLPNRYFDITPGVSLPVRVGAQKLERILVDWDSLDAAGGQEIVEKAANQYKRDRVNEFQNTSSEARQYAEAGRQADRAVVEELIGMFQAGQRSADEVAEVIDDYVAGGSLTDQEGAAAKARMRGAS